MHFNDLKSKFYINNSLIIYNNNIKYIENYIENGSSMFRLISLEKTDILFSIINLAINGVFLDVLIKLLVDNGYNKDESYEFILDLINAQIIFNESCSINNDNNKEINTNDDQGKYGSATDKVLKYNIYQYTEMLHKPSEVIGFLHKAYNEIDALIDVKHYFNKNYIDRMVDFLSLFDDDLFLRRDCRFKEEAALRDPFWAHLLPYNKIEAILMDKYIAAIKNNEKIINFDRTDLDNVSQNRNTHNYDASCSYNIYCYKTQHKTTYIKYIAEIGCNKGYNATDDDFLFVEIVFPRNDLNNPFIIKIINNKNCEDRFISIMDLAIYINNNKLFLYSKQHKKTIVITKIDINAINYIELPDIYKFLYYIHLDDKNKILSFKWGKIFNIFKYLPRIQYEEYILSLQRWTISEPNINEWQSYDDHKLMGKILEIKDKYNLPNKIVVPAGYADIIVDLCKMSDIRILLSLEPVKLRPQFKALEYIP